MNYNNILISIIFLLSCSTVIANGILMVSEKNNLDFNNLSSIDKGYIFCLIYSELYLGIILIYNIIYYLYYYIFSCYSNGSLKFQYNCWKALFLFSGIITHIYLFYILITNTTYIDTNIHTINIVFNVNFLITLFLTIIFKYFKCKNNKVENYENLN